MQIPTLALSITALLAGLALLAFSIVRTLAVLRDSVIARLPVAAEQAVSLPAAGTIQLCVEHPRFDASLMHAGFSLRDAAGRALPSAPILVPTRVSGFSSVRSQMRSFSVPAPGSYRLSVSGVAPGADTSRNALVLQRPYGARLVLCILGMVLGGAGGIGGLVFTSLRFAGKIP